MSRNFMQMENNHELEDENLPPKLKSELLRLNPKIDIMRVGEENMPTLKLRSESIK